MTTRRATMVAYLREADGFTSGQLSAALAVPGVSEFLTRAQKEGVSNEEVADRLVAFKEGGGSGLQNAIKSITAEFDANGLPAAPAGEATLSDVLGAIKDLTAAINESY